MIPMSFWIALWKIVLVGSVLLFACLAVWVTIGGFFDVKRLFQRITEEHERNSQQQEQET